MLENSLFLLFIFNLCVSAFLQKYICVCYLLCDTLFALLLVWKTLTSQNGLCRLDAKWQHLHIAFSRSLSCSVNYRSKTIVLCFSSHFLPCHLMATDAFTLCIMQSGKTDKIESGFFYSGRCVNEYEKTQ